MNKLDLLDLEASDLLDVLHYYFDEDLRYGSGEGAQMHSRFRKHVFEVMYDMPYRYAIEDSDSTSSRTSEDGTEVKPFIPATEFDPDSFNPFGATLDAPIG